MIIVGILVEWRDEKKGKGQMSISYTSLGY